jgi:kinesin family protein 2/24
LDQYKFIFDGAFSENSSNEQVIYFHIKIYNSCVRPLINAAFDGAKVSCFAYGQTGSGKTYTMLGDGNNIKGLYLLAAQDVFNMINSFQDISVWVSFYEIYCGKLYDLLN